MQNIESPRPANTYDEPAINSKTGKQRTFSEWDLYPRMKRETAREYGDRLIKNHQLLSEWEASEAEEAAAKAEADREELIQRNQKEAIEFTESGILDDTGHLTEAYKNSTAYEEGEKRAEARFDEITDKIERAVEEGKFSREHADRLLDQQLKKYDSEITSIRRNYALSQESKAEEGAADTAGTLQDAVESAHQDAMDTSYRKVGMAALASVLSAIAQKKEADNQLSQPSREPKVSEETTNTSFKDDVQQPKQEVDKRETENLADFENELEQSGEEAAKGEITNPEDIITQVEDLISSEGKDNPSEAGQDSQKPEDGSSETGQDSQKPEDGSSETGQDEDSLSETNPDLLKTDQELAKERELAELYASLETLKKESIALDQELAKINQQLSQEKASYQDLEGAEKHRMPDFSDNSANHKAGLLSSLQHEQDNLTQCEGRIKELEEYIKNKTSPYWRFISSKSAREEFKRAQQKLAIEREAKESMKSNIEDLQRKLRAVQAVKGNGPETAA